MHCSSRPLVCKCKLKSETGTLAEKAVKRLRRKEAQKHFDHVCMEGTELENVLCFTYFQGSNFEADGDCEQDVKIRMAIAKSTFGKLMEFWKAAKISLKQKSRLYSAAGCDLNNWLRNMGDATEAGGLTDMLECQVSSCYHRQRDLQLSI
jgi:hypothetical protein